MIQLHDLGLLCSVKQWAFFGSPSMTWHQILLLDSFFFQQFSDFPGLHFTSGDSAFRALVLALIRVRMLPNQLMYWVGHKRLVV